MTDSAITVIEVTVPVQGPALVDVFIPGPRGPVGPPGGAYLDYTQASPATTWTINHNFGYRPSVEIYSTGGMEMIADVLHTSVNQTVVIFNTATAGSARLI